MILLGYVFFVITQSLGLLLPNVLFDLNISTSYQAHYLAAFLGWIGTVILGAQLQFFRAIAGVRRYGPRYLRHGYSWSLAGGVTLLVIGSLLVSSILVYIGLMLYGVGISIHSYWIIPLQRSRLFRFPLNYLLAAHLFLLLAFGMIVTQALESPFFLVRNFEVIHVFGIGWISLSMQGAMIRALPMFVGEVIDRGYRRYLLVHFWASLTGSSVLIAGFLTKLPVLMAIGSVVWFGAWLWVIGLLVSSILLSNKELQYRITLEFVIPGMLFLFLGLVFGYISYYKLTFLPRGLHIHSSLLAGLSLVMLGFVHRITSFQAYTILFVGKDDRQLRLDDFLKVERVKYALPIFWVAPAIVLVGFYFNQYSVIALGGILNLFGSLLFGWILYANFRTYLKFRKSAIPYWLKKAEAPVE